MRFAGLLAVGVGCADAAGSLPPAEVVVPLDEAEVHAAEARVADAEEPPVASLRPIEACPSGLPRDTVEHVRLSSRGDVLGVGWSYDGGCAEHEIALCWDGRFLESYPVQVHLRLDHDDNGDPCEARIRERDLFDLSSIRKAYQEAYQTDAGAIAISTDDGGSILYEF